MYKRQIQFGADFRGMGGKYCHENGQAQLTDDFLVCLEAKRAVLYELDKIIQKANSAKAQGNERGEDGKAIGPVSYTPLDVYKRQQ